MKRMLLAGLALGCFGIAFGQEAPPRPCPIPVRPYVPADGPALPGDALDHLLSAAEHLEAAGLPEQAAALRQLAEQEKCAVVRRIEELEAELGRLRALVAEPQVLVKVKMIELSRGKLRKLGFDFAALDAGHIAFGRGRAPGGGPFEFGVVTEDDSLLGVLEALRRDKLVRVLAEPTLVTLSGRPAHCHVGGEIPAPVPQEDGTLAVELRQYGTRVDLVPIVLGGERIRLELRVQVAEVDPSRSVEIEGQTCPGLNVREVDTGVAMKAGQTLILGGLVEGRTGGPGQETPRESEPPEAGEPDAAGDEAELLVVVQPTIVYPLKPALSANDTRQPVPEGVQVLPTARAILHPERRAAR